MRDEMTVRERHTHTQSCFKRMIMVKVKRENEGISYLCSRRRLENGYHHESIVSNQLHQCLKPSFPFTLFTSSHLLHHLTMIWFIIIKKEQMISETVEDWERFTDSQKLFRFTLMHQIFWRTQGRKRIYWMLLLLLDDNLFLLFLKESNGRRVVILSWNLPLKSFHLNLFLS